MTDFVVDDGVFVVLVAVVVVDNVNNVAVVAAAVGGRDVGYVFVHNGVEKYEVAFKKKERQISY